MYRYRTPRKLRPATKWALAKPKEEVVAVTIVDRDGWMFRLAVGTAIGMWGIIGAGLAGILVHYSAVMGGWQNS